MDRTTLLTKLQQAFDLAFPGRHVPVTRELVAGDVPGWDSLVHLSLMIYVESAFGIRFPLDRIAGLQNVGEMMDLIDELVGEAPRR